MTPSPITRLAERRGREVAFTCDPSGRVTWADPRAVRRLGLRVGRSLSELARAGADDRIAELCRRAVGEELEDWSLALEIGDRPTTVIASTEPVEGGFALIGVVLPDERAGESAPPPQPARETARGAAQHGQEVRRLSDALSESNRGILQLHDELQQRAAEAATSAELKARLVANVSHEFRTPIHSILGLSQLLLDEADGPLGEEQRTQVRFVRAAAEELALLVNDMLDLSRVDAGQAAVRSARFSARELLETMRGMLRPIVPPGGGVELRIDVPSTDVELETDRGKLAQILRNLVSNGIKYTERGEVSLDVRQEDGAIQFVVRDSGIGIAGEELPRIFEDFYRSPSVAHVRGTGLGLPLSRKLAELLGGSITVESEPGEGSTFTLTIPRIHPEVRTIQEIQARSRTADPGRTQVLVVEDDRKTIFVYERYLSMAGFQVIPARSIEEAREQLRVHRPAAIVLDIMLEGETSWQFLSDVKSDPGTRDIPVLVVTVMNREQKARALGADEFWLKPLDQDRLIRRLEQIASRSGPVKLLVIDDDERSRYLVRRLLADTPYALLEAATGQEGIRIAQDHLPHVILLDFLLDDTTAFDVIDTLKSDPRTRPIPIVIISSHALGAEERERLAATTESILSKENLSRELAMQRIRDALHKAGIRPNAGAAGARDGASPSAGSGVGGRRTGD